MPRHTYYLKEQEWNVFELTMVLEFFHGRFYNFDILNERYARHRDGREVIYGRPCKTISLKDCKQYAARLDVVIAKTRGYYFEVAGIDLIPRFWDLECSKELMMLQLIAAQVDTVLGYWGILEGREPHEECDVRDVVLCDELDTLLELERKAEDMNIPYYERFLVESYHDQGTECGCTQCEPTVETIGELWYIAEIRFEGLKEEAPALYDRVFCEIRKRSEGS